MTGPTSHLGVAHCSGPSPETTTGQFEWYFVEPHWDCGECVVSRDWTLWFMSSHVCNVITEIHIWNNSDIMNVICHYCEKLSEANSIKIYTCEEMTEVFLSLVRLVVITINYY